ncbi:MAG: type I DNA topoisomerase [Bacteroidales bacterium]|nr:type I DNA topoisomerase [Bacteroidales bacterium]
MGENLVIVESPAKAKTIEKFLGKDFQVKSSFGHIRDLAKKNFGVDLNNHYKPIYIVPDDKKKVVSELKKAKKQAKLVWLASDEDREGEAIAWHLSEVLGLKKENTRRIVFHEITKDAIQNAIKNPRDIDINLVKAQQARRVLDRLVGFELSPVLWKKIKPSLSAGRVQSVAVKLIVEKEREILSFTSSSSYRLIGEFWFLDENNKKVTLIAELARRITTKKEAIEFLNICQNSEFKITKLVVKPSFRSPAPPFTTSTLQQEAGRKLGFSVGQTMAVAQKLYESGKITYMRTDSVNMSSLALNMAKKVISNKYGQDYHQFRKYKTKAKGAQEAHEAIRPTYIEKDAIIGSSGEKRLYDLIWKRTVASQMSNSKLEKTTATISIKNSSDLFIATGEVIKFDGFLKVYKESQEGESENNKTILPPLTNGQLLNRTSITATEKFTQAPFRYSEPSLVKKMEELGIGRPSTYAPTISTIQQRGYVLKEDRQGGERDIIVIELKDNNPLVEKKKKENFGKEKSKLFPTDIGMVVNDFLNEHFNEIMNFNFTASVEKEFDWIAEGELPWTQMIDKFYKSFHKEVEKSLELVGKTTGERVLGNDPNSGEEVIVKVGRYGPLAQLGKAREDYKPKFAGLRKEQRIDTISLEEALDLFKLPRTIGTFEDNDLIVAIGRFGPYIRHDGKFYSLNAKTDDPLTVNKERSIEIIQAKREADKNKILKQFEENKEVQILNGRYGPYISFQKKNYKIPKSKDPASLSIEDCMKLISEGGKNKKTMKKK